MIDYQISEMSVACSQIKKSKYTQTLTPLHTDIQTQRVVSVMPFITGFTRMLALEFSFLPLYQTDL